MPHANEVVLGKVGEGSTGAELGLGCMRRGGLCLLCKHFVFFVMRCDALRFALQGWQKSRAFLLFCAVWRGKIGRFGISRGSPFFRCVRLCDDMSDLAGQTSG
jgi:hypothetical protein